MYVPEEERYQLKKVKTTTYTEPYVPERERRVRRTRTYTPTEPYVPEAERAPPPPPPPRKEEIYVPEAERPTGLPTKTELAIQQYAREHPEERGVAYTGVPGKYAVISEGGYRIVSGYELQRLSPQRAAELGLIPWGEATLREQAWEREVVAPAYESWWKDYEEQLARHEQLSGLVTDINRLIEETNKLGEEIYELGLDIRGFREEILETKAWEVTQPKPISVQISEFLYGGGLETTLHGWIGDVLASIGVLPKAKVEEIKAKYKHPRAGVEYVGGPVAPLEGVTGVVWLGEASIGKVEQLIGKPSIRSEMATWEELGLSYAIIGGTVAGGYALVKYGPRAWGWVKAKVTRKLFPERYYFEKYITTATKVDVDTTFKILTKTGKKGWSYRPLSITEKPIVTERWQPSLWRKPKGWKPTTRPFTEPKVLPTKTGMALYTQYITKQQANVLTKTVSQQAKTVAKMASAMAASAVKPRLEEPKLEELEKEVSIPYLVRSTLAPFPSKYAMKKLLPSRFEMPRYPTLRWTFPKHPLERLREKELEETLRTLKPEQPQIRGLRQREKQTFRQVERQLSKMEQTIKQIQPQLVKESQLIKQIQPQLVKESQLIRQIVKETPKPPPLLPWFQFPEMPKLPRGGGFWAGWFKRVHPIATPEQVMRTFGLVPPKKKRKITKRRRRVRKRTYII